MALSVNRLINVSLTISPLAAPARGFGTLLIIGDSDAISSDERYRSYTNINDVASDFGVESEEYKAAALYYAQDPAPTNLMIARWNKVAAPSELRGAVLTDEEKQLGNWVNIVDGTFAYRLNNKVVPVEGLNFEGQTNMNGIADVINSKLSDIKIKWDGERFIASTLATGSDQQLGYFEPAAAQTNVHTILGLSAGLAAETVGQNRIDGTPEQPATPGTLTGTNIAESLSTLKGITEGSFKLNIDGEQLSLTRLNFSTANSLNDIADIITANLSSKGTATYNGESLVITSASTGSASTVNGATVGEITTPAADATAGYLTGTDISSQLETYKAISDGSFKITVDSTEESLTGLDFTSCVTMDNVAEVIAAKLTSKATVTYTGESFRVTSASTGAASTVTNAVAGEITTPAADATAGTFTGGAISDDVTQLSTLKAITDGTLKLTIDAGAETETAAINLSAATDLANVATLITAAVTGATVTYSASDKKFIITSATKGAASKVLVTAGTNPALFNALLFNTGTPVAGKDAVAGTDNQLHVKLGLSSGTSTPGKDAVTANDNQLHVKLGLSGGSSVNGKDRVPEVPAVPATPGKLTGGKHADLTQIKGIRDGNFTINIDSSLTQTVEDLDFSTISTLSDVADVIGAKLRNATISAVGDVLVITSSTTGSNSRVSYAGPAALNEQDISAKLKMTRETGLNPVNGFDAESPLQVVEIMCNRTANWYGCTFAVSDMPTDDQLVDVAQYIEAQTDTTRIFGITATDTRVLDREYKDDIASRCSELGLNRTLIQYSQNPYAVCSFLGRAFTVNFNGSMTTITMMYKGEPSVEAEDLTESQAQTLTDKRCNVFVKYNNDTSIIQNGVMSGDYWFDERHGSDWLKDYVQNAIWNYVYTSTTKVGQDDAGINNIVSVINDCLIQAKTNGFIGAGTWLGDGFGQLSHGQYMADGFYVYAPPMSTQTQAERAARVSVPIQVAAKLLGALHSFDVAITLDR